MLPTAHSAAACCLTAWRSMSRRSATGLSAGALTEVRQWLADGLDVEPETTWDSLREWSRGAGLGNLRELGVPHEARVCGAGSQQLLINESESGAAG